MYFMQLAGSVMPAGNDNENDKNKIDTTSFAFYDVADKYEKAKRNLIATNVLCGISHAHYVDTYVVISNKTKESDYK